MITTTVRKLYNEKKRVYNSLKVGDVVTTASDRSFRVVQDGEYVALLPLSNIKWDVQWFFIENPPIIDITTAEFLFRGLSGDIYYIGTSKKVFDTTTNSLKIGDWVKVNGIWWSINLNGWTTLDGKIHALGIITPEMTLEECGQFVYIGQEITIATTQADKTIALREFYTENR